MWNGPKKFISHVLLQSSFWILFSVMYILFARHLFWWWFCIATLRLWPVKWQLKHSKSLYLHLSGVWLANPQRKQRFLWWRRPTERPREHTLSRLIWFTPDEELSPWGFPPKCCTSFYAIFCSVPCFLKKRSWPIIIFRLICCAWSPQMKQSRRISFNSKLVNSHFPVSPFNPLTNSTRLCPGFWFAE